MGVATALRSRPAPVATRARGATAEPRAAPAHAPASVPGGAGARYLPTHAATTHRAPHAAVQFCGAGCSHAANRPTPAEVTGSLGPGRPLPASAASTWSSAYGTDLAGVSVHEGSPMPGRYGAHAMTVGSHVAFAPGAFDPGSGAGRELLGHELAHVVQQRGGSRTVQASGGTAGAGASAGEAHEVEADAAARAALSGASVPRLSPVTGPAMQGDEGPMCHAPSSSAVSTTASGGDDVPGPLASGPMCMAPQSTSQQSSTSPLVSTQPPQWCEAPAPAALLTAKGPLAERVAAFKSLVRTTAILRLRGNQSNLAKWSYLVFNAIPTGDLAATGLLQSGGSGAYFQIQDTRDPAMRDLLAHQVEGRYRACTGCHVAKEITATRGERSLLGGQEWLTPNEQRAGVPAPGLSGFGGTSFGPGGTSFGPGGTSFGPGGTASGTPYRFPAYRPTPGTAEARLHEMFPDPQAVPAQMERARPILEALGPSGYRVLPADILASLRTSSPDALRCRINTLITERSEGYETLIGKIRGGTLGYEHFGPIIRDLLPAADPDVRTAITKEMDDHAFWQKVEAVVVGVLTVGALLLAIFPPTSAAGLVALGALEVGLGVYGGIKGAEMMETGSAYSLATGAHDVLTPGQQQSGGFMVLGGFLGVALAPLAVVGGAARAASATSRFGGLTIAGAQAGQTLQRGKYVMTLAEDGSLVVTLTDRADILIIVRGDTATAYQLTGTGMRVLETARVPAAGAAAPGATPGGGTPLALPAPRPYTDPAPVVLPSRAPAAGEAPAYLMPIGQQGTGGVLVMGRGLRPADFNLVAIADDPALLTMWNDALRAAATTGRANAYTRYLDAVADGTVTGWTSQELGAAFDVVNSRFMAAARQAGRDVATVHHWNFPKSQYPYAITDPAHLVPIPEQAALRGGWHPVHQGGLHPLMTSNPARPTAGPVAPVHEIPLTGVHPLTPPQ